MIPILNPLSSSPFNPDSAILGRQVIADFVEMLEQAVNSALLSIIASTFASPHSPLDAFVLASVTSNSQVNNLQHFGNEHGISILF